MCESCLNSYKNVWNANLKVAFGVFTSGGVQWKNILTLSCRVLHDGKTCACAFCGRYKLDALSSGYPGAAQSTAFPCDRDLIFPLTFLNWFLENRCADLLSCAVKHSSVGPPGSYIAVRQQRREKKNRMNIWHQTWCVVSDRTAAMCFRRSA